MEQHEQVTTAAKGLADGAAVMIVGGAFFQWLPSATALLTFVWVCIRLYETKTVQALIARIFNHPLAAQPVVISSDDE